MEKPVRSPRKNTYIILEMLEVCDGRTLFVGREPESKTVVLSCYLDGLNRELVDYLRERDFKVIPSEE